MTNELNKRMGYFLQSSKKKCHEFEKQPSHKIEGTLLELFNFVPRMNGSFSLSNLFTSHKERTKSINNVKEIIVITIYQLSLSTS